MRVMIVNPRFHLPIDTRTSPHLWLAYLAAVSEQRGDDVLVYDADVEDEPITTVVKRFDPHVVGITTNTPQVRSAWRTAQAIKAIKDVPVVLGGPHVSGYPPKAQPSRRLMWWYVVRAKPCGSNCMKSSSRLPNKIPLAAHLQSSLQNHLPKKE